MRGAIPPLTHTSSWRDSYLSTKDNFTFTLIDTDVSGFTLK
jgi:hypothetical protein